MATSHVSLEAELQAFNTQQYPTVYQTIRNNRSVLYKRKKHFLSDLRSSIQVVEVVLIIIIYLRDVSFFKLIIRYVVHLSIKAIDPHHIIQNFGMSGQNASLSGEHRRSMVKISLRGLLLGNLFCLLSHLLLGVRTQKVGVFGDEYSYGGMNVMFIGEKLPSSRFEIVAFDLAIFATQLIFHYLSGIVEDSEVLEGRTALGQELGTHETELQEVGIQTRDSNETMESSAGGEYGESNRVQKVLTGEDGYDGNVHLLTIDLMAGIEKVMNYEIISRIYRPEGNIA
ncbi:hypothetical protein PVL30_000559 [Lodderomyces elongisporus]|uniref:uncharacterized protein n=1 Tax=Lodderomyces elongisporus TaxID=36914 RepID=UPI00292633D7|nr:uncharacterized protein PVL30_000559 [Lodderomyces elongisporus]WLF76855.1 hypothetical protein PVL30_000559 [Lodderomyces elongisporus]